MSVQYRDAETEENLDGRYEEALPNIGTRVRIGFSEYEVLYRWRCVPTACVIYVRSLPSRMAEAA